MKNYFSVLSPPGGLCKSLSWSIMSIREKHTHFIVFMFVLGFDRLFFGFRILNESTFVNKFKFGV